MARPLLTTLLLIVSVLTTGCDNWPCKKGKPCGHACISKQDTCHKG